MHLARYDTIDREARVELDRHAAWLKQMRRDLDHASTHTSAGGTGGSDLQHKGALSGGILRSKGFAPPPSSSTTVSGLATSTKGVDLDVVDLDHKESVGILE